MKTSRLLPLILLPLLLCSLAQVATAAAATGNFPTRLSSQTAAHVAPWIALNQAVMQRLAASSGAAVAGLHGTPRAAHGVHTCNKNQEWCDCRGKCVTIGNCTAGCI